VGEMVEFPVNGGSISGYEAAPENGGGPGVVVIQEWWGLVDHIKDVCDRFAAAGFVALAPDHYHGKTTKCETDSQAHDQRQMEQAPATLLSVPCRREARDALSRCRSRARPPSARR